MQGGWYGAGVGGGEHSGWRLTEGEAEKKKKWKSGAERDREGTAEEAEKWSTIALTLHSIGELQIELSYKLCELSRR